MRNNLALNAYNQNEGILRFNTQAKKSLAEGDIEKRVHWLNRSASIFGELMNSLNHNEDGATSEYLAGLYAFQMEKITQANMEEDVTLIDEINVVVRGLLDAWREVKA